MNGIKHRLYTSIGGNYPGSIARLVYDPTQLKLVEG
jgi:hypothetical protein